MLNDIEIEPDSALIIGQLFIDKACQKGTKFLNLLDYKARIRDIAANHQKVYLIKHPLMPEKDFSKIVSGLNIEKLVYLQNVNVYELMSNKNVKTVIAVSSSVLIEAKYFNKQVVCLYKSPIDDNYVNIYECFFDAQFWINVLQLTDLTSTWSYYHYDNFLRHKFDAFYAYEKFAKNTIALSADQEAQLVYQSLVDLGRNIEAVNKYQSVVLYGYGTVAKLILPQLSVPVRGIVDKALTMKNIVEIDDISVLTPLDLVDGDNVVICAFKYNHEIKVQLNSIGKNLNITSLL
ncbi:polysialyltransferase family glycosyltransferase [Paraglaciecola aquimarina]|uniref:Polysialyltransferase family glycosyltransferase n=1 Tax=Paraglaciecola aquimarina TaxID=1235557 RepID=A0ABU3T0B9_9ALTE|nr:polysialyltransferase family glycosyltransferase [Paraglaciecola aquimarina]MDU0355706.1 polysialyltransferase family glycosyltransferase [Paraglaciecola aquimarina]